MGRQIGKTNFGVFSTKLSAPIMAQWSLVLLFIILLLFLQRGFQNQLLNPCFKRLCIYWYWQEFGKPNSISINLLHFAYHEWKLHTLTKSGYLLSSVRKEGRELRGSKRCQHFCTKTHVIYRYINLNWFCQHV